MTDKEVFEAVQQRFTDPKIMDLLRAGLVDKDEMEDAKRALRYGDAVMRNPILRDKLYKIFDRLLNVVKDDSTTRQMVKQDLRQLQKTQGDEAMSENLDTANVEKAVKHDCAKHVVHEQWGKGQCIPGEHTLLDDGTVTHYDVMFEHGIEQNVAVEDLTVVVSESHMHAKKKKAMEEEAVAPEGGADSSKASKKGKPEMPMERLKAIMEKKKSEAYKAMLRSQGKMEEEVEQTDEGLLKKVGQAVGKGLEKGGAAVTNAIQKNKVLRTLAGDNVREEVEQVDEKLSPFSSVGKFLMHGKLRGKENKFAYTAHSERPLTPDEHKERSKVRKVGTRLGFDVTHEETELDEKKLTSAEMKKREEVAKAIKRDQPGMPMGKKMAIATATAKKVAEEKAHTVPKTSKEKSLAALAPPHDKITHADVMVGRGVGKKKSLKEFVEQLSESLLVEGDDKHEDVGMHNGDVFKPPLHGGYKSTQDNPKAHENVEKAHHEMVDHIARHLPHMSPADRKSTIKSVSHTAKKFHSDIEIGAHEQTDDEAERIQDHHAKMRSETRSAQQTTGLHSSKTLHGQLSKNPKFQEHHNTLKRALENGDHKTAENAVTAIQGMAKGK